jgi:pimeloyl-ACP methyl ester carboxylesterase
MKSQRIRRKRWLFTLTVVVFASLGFTACHGCSQWIAHAIVDAPNARRSVDCQTINSSESLGRLGISRELHVNVGPPPASLSLWIVDPSIDASETRVSSQCRGTILVLHGIRDGKKSQVDLGRRLAAAGFRAVLVDLRGHGQSTGQWLTYGVVESRDLVQVLDALEQQQLLQGSVGVIGASYGGVVGIQLSSIDPRVKAVVAIAPFASLRDIVPEYLANSGFGWAVSEATLAESMRLAGELADFDPAQASPINSIASMRADVLLIHGKADRHIRCEHSQRLHNAAPDHSRLILLEGEDHVTIMQDRNGVILRESQTLFDQTLRPLGDQ